VPQRVGEGGLGDDVAELDAQGDDRLRDLRPDPGHDALGAHQPGRHHRLEQVLGDLGVHRGHAGDVDDRVRGTGVHQGLQQLLHDHLGARGVERADQRDADHPVPQLDHRGGQLEQLLGLGADDLLPGGRVGVDREHAEVVDQPAQREVGRDVGGGTLIEQLLEARLEGEHAHRGLGRAEPLPGAVARELGEQRAHLGVRLTGHVHPAGAQGLEDRAVQLVQLLIQLGPTHPAGQRS
jgi:hypothetical protein